MIGVGYIKTMSAYMAWQNNWLFQAASGLSETQRCEDRGAFFGSIHHTLCHLCWGDRVWASRLCGYPPPRNRSIAGSVNEYADWETLETERTRLDQAIQRFATELSSGDLEGDIEWDSAATGRLEKVARPLAWVHMFNHQTHHRGQVHAMLTAAGAQTMDTDIVFMPGLRAQ